MLEFSIPHTYRGNASVQQILVFPSVGEKERFNAYLEKSPEIAVNKGAIYILRAIKEGESGWRGFIRHGTVNDQCDLVAIWTSSRLISDSTQCLRNCIAQLGNLLFDKTIQESNKYQLTT